LQGCFQGCLRGLVAWVEAIGIVWMRLLGFSVVAWVLAFLLVVYVCWCLVTLTNEDWENELQEAEQAG
jgi:fatty acid desaturase